MRRTYTRENPPVVILETGIIARVLNRMGPVVILDISAHEIHNEPPFLVRMLGSKTAKPHAGVPYFLATLSFVNENDTYATQSIRLTAPDEHIAEAVARGAATESAYLDERIPDAHCTITIEADENFPHNLPTML